MRNREGSKMDEKQITKKKKIYYNNNNNNNENNMREKGEGEHGW